MRHEHNRLVVITGTGVSLYSAGFPDQPGTDVAGWPGLLNSGVEYCRANGLIGHEGDNIVRQQIASGSTTFLIDAAGMIHKWLSARSGARYFWMKDSVGRLKLHDSSLIKAIQALGGVMATLNYDKLQHLATGRPEVHWRQRDKIDGYLRSGSKEFILHLHGCWEELDSVVLDQPSYTLIANDPEMRQVMHDFARWKTILFIGCGTTFADPNFDALIKWCEGSLKDAKFRHFILCRQDDEAPMRESLKPYGFLEPLPYGADYADLVPFLSDLAKDSGAKTAAANPPIATTGAVASPSIPNAQKPSDIWKQQTQG